MYKSLLQMIKVTNMSDKLISISLQELIDTNYKPTNDLANTLASIRKVKHNLNDKNLMSFHCVGSQSYSSANGHIVNIYFNNGIYTSKLLNQDVRVFCSCPAFRYWGSAYNATYNDYHVIDETRAPNIRDPHRLRKVCKHIAGVRTLLLKPWALKSSGQFIDWDDEVVLSKVFDLTGKIPSSAKEYSRLMTKLTLKGGV